MQDESQSFADYLVDLMGGEGYWEGELTLVPKNLTVAVLSLLQHLVEELKPSPLAPSLIAPVIALNNALGACEGVSD